MEHFVFRLGKQFSVRFINLSVVIVFFVILYYFWFSLFLHAMSPKIYPIFYNFLMDNYNYLLHIPSPFFTQLLVVGTLTVFPLLQFFWFFLDHFSLICFFIFFFVFLFSSGPYVYFRCKFPFSAIFPYSLLISLKH